MNMVSDHILVTGATSGIGRAIVLALSKDHKVIAHGRDLQKLNLLVSDCSGNVEVWHHDLALVDSIETALTDYIALKKISVGAIVHCAGDMRPVKTVKLSEILQTFNVNIFSATLIVKTLLNFSLNKKNLKNIIFISSNISNFGAKGMAIYAASKAAVDGLMRSLAIELAPNVRVNSVLPGALNTAMTAHIFSDEEIAKRLNSMTPMGVGEVEDIVNAVRFLLSDSSRWIAGHQLTVDGGRTINLSA